MQNNHIFNMNGNKMAVVILNNHCHICNFFNPEGKSPKYFQMRKQILLFSHEFGYFDITREII